MALKNGFGTCSLFVLSANGVNRDIKHGLFVFPPKKPLIWRRRCSIGQSCYSMTSKESIDWFLESSGAKKLFQPSILLTTQKPRTRVFIRSINLSNRSIYVHLLFLFCFHVFISRSCKNRPHDAKTRFTELFLEKMAYSVT